jgi:hypothetical protein
MKTKKELLARMNILEACWDAREYVRNHPSNNIAVIGETCKRLDWLIWFLGQEKQLFRFTRVCVIRATKYNNNSVQHKVWLKNIKLQLKEYNTKSRVDSLWIAADGCASGVRWMAPKEHDEYADQLKGLQRIWREHCTYPGTIR